MFKSQMIKDVNPDISVKVEPVFLEKESCPQKNHYVWSYSVTIQNNGDKTVILKNRHWTIADNNGFTRVVKGDGVVGQRPCLKPGQTYSYTSGAPLKAPGGMMLGSYTMQSEDGHMFDVEIPAFSLDSPHQRILVH